MSDDIEEAERVEIEQRGASIRSRADALARSSRRVTDRRLNLLTARR